MNVTSDTPQIRPRRFGVHDENSIVDDDDFCGGARRAGRPGSHRAAARQIRGAGAERPPRCPSSGDTRAGRSSPSPAPMRCSR